MSRTREPGRRRRLGAYQLSVLQVLNSWAAGGGRDCAVAFRYIKGHDSGRWRSLAVLLELELVREQAAVEDGRALRGLVLTDRGRLHLAVLRLATAAAGEAPRSLAVLPLDPA